VSDDKAPRRYAKGEAKRREILNTALDLIGQRGYGASTLQEIADAVGLTKAGVLHYFESREELIASILRERDEVTSAASVASLEGEPAGMLEMLLQASVLNTTTPGLVELYSRLVVDAAGPDHPAHAYIDDRYDQVVSAVAEEAATKSLVDASTGQLDPETFARVVVAISDGLQLQWSYRRDFDMHRALGAAISALTHGAVAADVPNDGE
jgi:AcrR family transcriptional regulator